MEELKIQGWCRGRQTYLEYEEKNGVIVPIDTGIVVPGTDTGWEKNTIQSNFLYYVPYHLAKSSIATTGSPITSGTIQRGNIYKVTGTAVVQSGVTIPANCIFVSDGTTVTWGGGAVTLCKAGYDMGTLFASQGTRASVGAANAGKDGIAHFDPDIADYILLTTLNAGGTDAEAYLEFYGYIDGVATLSVILELGARYDNSTYTFAKKWATVSISQSVAAARRYGHYWKITIS